MSQLRIRNALEKHLSLFATAKSIPVVWENISTIPSGNYLKATIFPSPTQDPSIGASHQRYQGFFRITYYSTELNKGVKSVEEIVRELIEHFPRGLQLSKDNLVVHVERTPSSTSLDYLANYLYISVEMYYRADVIN